MPGALGFITWRRLLEWMAIVAGFVVVHFVGQPHSWIGWLMMLPAGVLVAIPVILAAQREYAREHEAASAAELAAGYRTRLGAALGDTVIPLAELIDRINSTAGEERSLLQAQLIQGVVDSAAAQCGGDGTRAALYVLNDGAMVRSAWSGRAVAPEPAFDGRPDRRMREIMRHRGRLLVPDLSDSSVALRMRADDPFRSALFVVVTAGGLPFGLLVVHASKAGELTEDDLELAATLAQLLGAGMASPPRPARRHLIAGAR
jgi:hypothetical protein